MPRWQCLDYPAHGALAATSVCRQAAERYQAQGRLGRQSGRGWARSSFFFPLFFSRVWCVVFLNFDETVTKLYQTATLFFFPFGVQTKFPKRFGFRTFGFPLGPFGFRLGKMFYLCRFKGNLSLLKVFCPGDESANGGTVWSTAPSFYPCAGSLEQSCKILVWC